VPRNLFCLENHIQPPGKHVIRTKENAFSRAQIWRQSDFPVVAGFALLQGCVILPVCGIHYAQLKENTLSFHCYLAALDRNYLSDPKEDIFWISPTMIMIGGRIVFQKE